MNLILTAGPDPSSHVRSSASRRSSRRTQLTQLANAGRRHPALLPRRTERWRSIFAEYHELGGRTVSPQGRRDQDVPHAAGQRAESSQRARCVPFSLALGQMLMVVVGDAAGNRWCIRANLMNSLPDECIHQTVAAFKNIPERSGPSSLPLPRARLLIALRTNSLALRNRRRSHRRPSPLLLLLPRLAPFRSLPSRRHVRSLPSVSYSLLTPSPQPPMEIASPRRPLDDDGTAVDRQCHLAPLARRVVPVLPREQGGPRVGAQVLWRRELEATRRGQEEVRSGERVEEYVLARRGRVGSWAGV